jgi:hypothetical protein
MKPTSSTARQRALDFAQDLLARSRLSSRTNSQGEFDHLLVVMPAGEFSRLYSPMAHAVLCWRGIWLAFGWADPQGCDLLIRCRETGRSFRVVFAETEGGRATQVRFMVGESAVGSFRVRKFSRETLCETPYGRQVLARMAARVLSRLSNDRPRSDQGVESLPAIQIVPQVTNGTAGGTLFQQRTLQ